MAEETPTPSVDESVTPTSTPQPVKGNAPSGATPPTEPSLTLEEALKRIADLERKQQTSEGELTRHRQNAGKLAKYEKEEQERQQAALSDVEKANKRATDAEAKIQQYRAQLVTAQVKFAAQSKGIIDPDLAALAIQADLELDDDGMPTNLEKALEKLIKNKPYLVAAKTETPTASTSPAQTAVPAQVATPAIPAANPGRSTIPNPNTQRALPQGNPWNSGIFKRQGQ